MTNKLIKNYEELHLSAAKTISEKEKQLISKKDERGRTPLHHCLSASYTYDAHREKAVNLVAHGVLLSEDNDGNTPLDLYDDNGCSEYKQQTKMAKKKDLRALLEAWHRDHSPVEEPDQISLERYKMTSTGVQRRGICLIINNIKFEEHTKLNTRKGSYVDEKRLEFVFIYLGFEVCVYRDATASKMKRLIKEVSKENHAKYDCFVCCILSHGDEGIVVGTDGKRCKITDFTNAFLECATLAGKPKLFFLQACQGSKMPEPLLQLDATIAEGRPVSRSSSFKDTSTSGNADILVAYATLPGAVSFRDVSTGSIYINVLTDLLMKYHETTEILKILTLVNKQVSQMDCPFENTDGVEGTYKQASAFLCSLTKELFLTKHKLPEK